MADFPRSSMIPSLSVSKSKASHRTPMIKLTNIAAPSIVSYLSLLGYASDTLMRLGEDDDESNSAWMHDFRRLVGTTNVTTHEVTSLLCLLSASITNRQPLPPYLKTPRPYSFSKRLEALDSEILSLKHMSEPGFAAFAVLQISTRCIVGDVERLMRLVVSPPKLPMLNTDCPEIDT